MLTRGKSCVIAPYGAHTANFERTECIWCGPGEQAWKPGRWVPIEGGQAWSVVEIAEAR